MQNPSFSVSSKHLDLEEKHLIDREGDILEPVLLVLDL